MKTYALWMSVVFAIGACLHTEGDDDALVDDVDESKADGDAAPRLVYCHTTGATTELVKLRFTPGGGTFGIEATKAGARVFMLASQRPALNVRIEDGASDVPDEFLDFRPSGLEVVPPLGVPSLELDLVTGEKSLVYIDATKRVNLQCRVSAAKLLAYLGVAPKSSLGVASAQAVGFDIDDTLLFSTPAFARAFATGGTPAPGDVVFWTQANGCDGGCAAETITLPDGTTKALPANIASPVKAKAMELVAYHQSRGAEVYAITARPDINGAPVRAYIESQLGIAADHVFFEPDIAQPGNPAGKTDRMQQLALDVFYGDADSDITDAQSVTSRTVRGIRFLRSPKSSNRKDGRLNKYHPGYYGETIVAGSYD